METRSHKTSEIVQFYTRKNIFITGASGYVGTLLVEKILRTCKHVNTLFLLFRCKRGQEINTRVKEYFNDEVFERMKLENPNYHKQVRIVLGDLLYDKFDLSKEDEEMLIQETHIIFHVAATVRFDEHIRVANQINVKGTRSVLVLAKQMPQLQSLVYVSTAYCNSDLARIEEKVHTPVYTEAELTQLVDSCTDEELSILTNHIIGGKPNTYTLTKSTAEALVDESKATLPISIIRPSIIMPTLTEPMPLYNKGLNLYLAIFLGVGLGVIRVAYVNGSLHIDTVPGDRTINAILGVGWFTTLDRLKHQYVFNYISGNDNPIQLKTAGKIAKDSSTVWKENCNHSIWTPHITYTQHPLLYLIYFYVLHILPCLLFIPLEACFTKEATLGKLYRKVWFFGKLSGFFTTREWVFVNDNTKAVLERLCDEDRQSFDFDLGNFRWEEIYSYIARSLSKYTLKDQFTHEKYKKKMIYIDRFESGVLWVAPIVVVWILCLSLSSLLNRFI